MFTTKMLGNLCFLPPPNLHLKNIYGLHDRKKSKIFKCKRMLTQEDNFKSQIEMLQTWLRQN